ncbi:MAG: DUF302 domain-containing protein [Thermoplasmatales archaeon]
MLFAEREFSGDFAELMDSLLFHLKNSGYVAVADIDVKGILKRTMNLDFKEYHIFEICKPQAAKDLVGEDDNNGLFLPCKMVAFESEGKVRVRILLSSELTEKFNLGTPDRIKKYENELIGLFNSFVPRPAKDSLRAL